MNPAWERYVRQRERARKLRVLTFWVAVFGYAVAGTFILLMVVLP